MARTKTIMVRVSNEEMETIKKNACGKKTAEYMRDMGMKGGKAESNSPVKSPQDAVSQGNIRIIESEAYTVTEQFGELVDWVVSRGEEEQGAFMDLLASLTGGSAVSQLRGLYEILYEAKALRADKKRRVEDEVMQ